MNPDYQQIDQMVHGQYPDPAVVFRDHPVMDGDASRERGRPIHKVKPYVRIHYPGQKDTVERAAKPDDKKKYPEAWKRYLAQREQQQERSIDLLPSVSAAEAADLKALGVFTIERLAALNREAIIDFMTRRLDDAEAHSFDDFGKIKGKVLAEAERAADAAVEDFQAHIQEARSYVSDRNPAEAVGGNGAGRETVQSLPSGPADGNGGFSAPVAYEIRWTP